MTDVLLPDPPRRPNLIIGPAIVIGELLLGAEILRNPTGPTIFAFVMVGWVLAVMLHEFSHALVAYLAGDHTVAAKGYLTLDPLRYGSLGVSLVIPLLALMLGGVGFPGGAVYLRDDLMRSRAWRSAASLAGPAATLVILLALAFSLRLWAADGVAGPGQAALFAALTVLAFLQAMALILNLLPIPGLDGFNAIRPFLPASLAPAIRKAEGLAMVALILLIFVVPGASGGLFRASAVLGAAVGIDLDALQAGWRAFHFWRR